MSTYFAMIVHNGKESLNCVFDADADASENEIIEAFKTETGQQDVSSFRFYKSNIGYAQYFPRMGRPQMTRFTSTRRPASGPFYVNLENLTDPIPYDRNSLATSLNQLSILIKELEEIFRAIEPSPANMNCFGHRSRNVLLIAAMEFENECKGVLRANGVAANNNRWNTNDFVKLLLPLRLADYEVSLPFYPSIASRRPFAGWNATNPTSSLAWYEDYNAVKHDRETSINRATVSSAIDAVVACVIVLSAQYRIIDTWRDQIGEFFRIEASPTWSLGDQYIPPNSPDVWSSINYSF